MHVYYRSLGEIYLLETALYSVTLPVYYLYIQICHLFIIIICLVICLSYSPCCLCFHRAYHCVCTHHTNTTHTHTSYLSSNSFKERCCCWGYVVSRAKWLPLVVKWFSTRRVSAGVRCWVRCHEGIRSYGIGSGLDTMSCTSNPQSVFT